MPARTHGLTAGKFSARNYPRVYGIWKNMKQRCLNPRNPAFKRYGGAGIRVCRRWLVFENFYADMGNPPPGKTLDRKDFRRGYSPSNCRWATPQQQAVNSRRAVFYTFDGARLCISEWCRRTGISYGVFKARRKAGWSVRKALTTPPRKQYNNTYTRGRP